MKNKHDIVFFICILFTFISSSLAASSNTEVSQKKKISSPWGMNAHFVFDSAKRHMDQLGKAMKKAGVQIVRIDAYWDFDNLMGQQKSLDSAIFFADKYNLEVLLNFPTVPAKRDSLSIEKWCRMLKNYAQRYNGQTPIRIAKEERFPRVRYFEAMNEPDYHYKEMKFTAAETFHLIKMSSTAIRSVRPEPDVKIVLPGLCSFEPFVYELLNFKDTNGNTLKNYIDILSYHDYNKSDSGWEYDLKERMKSFSKAGLQDKEVWITEFGTNMYETTFEDQASFLSKRSVVSLAYGIDKIFYYQFHYYGGNTFAIANQREDFFGMVDTGVKNSFAQFLENRDEGNYSIMTGDTPIRIYMTPKTQKRKWVSLHGINNRILNQLQTKGLIISGKGFAIDSVVLTHKTTNKRENIWNGHTLIDSASGNNLALSPDLFQSVSKKNRILVYVDDIKDASGEWEEIRPFPVYSTYTFLTSLLKDGSSYPKKIKTKFKGFNVYRWQNQDGEKIYIFWSDSDKAKSLDLSKFSGPISIYNNYGAELQGTTIEVAQSPVFIVEKP